MYIYTHVYIYIYIYMCLCVHVPMYPCISGPTSPTIDKRSGLRSRNGQRQPADMTKLIGHYSI